MPKSKESVNPFYVLSGIAGVVFTITAFAYFVFMGRANQGSLAGDDGQPHLLMSLLDQHGLTILGIEVLVIGIVSVAAIVLDHFRGRRLAQRPNKELDHRS